MSKSRPQLGRRVDRPQPKAESMDSTTAIPEVPEVPAVETGSLPPAKSGGRPPGAKNREYVLGERHPGMCPKCKCTESKAESTKTIPLPNDPDYRYVSLIRCMCKKCGQWRVDRQKCNPAE